jgi:hypothetical protein
MPGTPAPRRGIDRTLASVTSAMRIGSGGVMLPNHAPLVVAEQFGMLKPSPWPGSTWHRSRRVPIN